MPERVTTLTMAPEAMPYSAENWLAMTANSRTASSEKPPRWLATRVSSLLAPSTRKLLLRVVCPAAWIPPPPTPAMPGVRFASEAKFRPASGSVSSSARVTVVPSVFLLVSTSGAAPVTVTVSSTDASLSATLTVASWPIVKREPGADLVGKAAQLRAQFIDARRQCNRPVPAALVGRLRPCPARFLVGNDDRRPGHDRALVVGDGALQRRAGALGRHW